MTQIICAFAGSVIGISFCGVVFFLAIKPLTQRKRRKAAAPPLSEQILNMFSQKRGE